jgi:hypothetical protein
VKSEDVEITTVWTERDGRVCEVELTVTRDNGLHDHYTVITD